MSEHTYTGMEWVKKMTQRKHTEADVEWAAWCLQRVASKSECGPIPSGWAFHPTEMLRASHALDHGYVAPPKPKSDRDQFAAYMERWCPLPDRESVHWQDAWDCLVKDGYLIEPPTPPKPKSIGQELEETLFGTYLNPTLGQVVWARDMADAILARFNVTRKEA